MPDLGSKHSCFSCGTKFYDLRKSPVLCPKCGTDQKDAPPPQTSPAALQAARRAKRDEFGDPDMFDRPRDDDDLGFEPEETNNKMILDDDELPLEGPTMEGSDGDEEDEY
ncbi:MAG: FYDLN acid domain-containing protein [Acidobacteria bacterium]|nr:FYDLN acid domain-containing protein [Acidobacteriota bacterium]MCG3191802.1 hypothetical protein [Thermoanaerobaculia bacterium]MCK6685392.1 FYDLN acid domain-containing protein [Thermoanaerobaculia bacterium]